MPPIASIKKQRRAFLNLAWRGGVALLLAGCAPIKPIPPTATLGVTASATPLPSSTPEFIPTATATLPATPTATVTPVPSPTPDPRTRVATGRAAAYDPGLLRAELERMLTDLGGIEDLVKPGSRVGLKVNLTGGTWWDTPDKPPATEFFVVNPAVVAALCAILRDLGAQTITVMDGLGDETAFRAWGYTALLKPLGVNLVDLCKPEPYGGFYRLPTGSGARIYDFFYVNGVLNELDAFVSVAKLKCHTTTGVTLSMKNLFGLVPVSAYRLKESDTNRSAFHGVLAFDERVPQVIVDLNQARPVQLALIDGVMTAEAGAGPWDKAMRQVKPGLLVAGKDPVATDAVSAALMGFDPEAPAKTSPFIGSDNHLAMAAAAGLGTHRLSEIAVHGPSIAEARFPFKPAR